MLYILYIYKEQKYIAFYKSVFHGFTHFFIYLYTFIFFMFFYIYICDYILNLLFFIIKFQKLYQIWGKLHSSCNKC